MSQTPAPANLPLRAQCGYVVKYSNVKQGKLTPGMIVGLLELRGDLGDHTTDEAKEIAAEVLEARRGDGDE